MADGKITIDIEIDGRPLRVVMNEFKSLENAAKESSKDVGEVSKSLNEVDGKSVQKASGDLNELDSSSKKSASEIDNLSSTISDVDGKSIDGVSKELNELDSDAKNSTGSIEEVSTSISGIDGSSIDKVSTELNEVSADARTSASGLGQVSDATNDISGEPVRKVGDELKGLDSNAKASTVGISEVGSAVSEVDGKNIGAVGQEFKELDADAKSSTSGINEVDSAVADINGKSVDELGREFTELDGEAKSSVGGVNQVSEAVADVDGKNIDAVGEEFKELDSEAKSSTIGVNEVSDAVSDIDGKPVKSTSEDVADLGSGADKSSGSVRDLSNSVSNVDGSSLEEVARNAYDIEPKSQKATSGLKDIVTALGLVQLASKAFSVMSSAMDTAIARFDTFQKFPKVMDAFGYSVEQATAAQNKLSDGIDGLPTKLDDVVNTSMQMTSMTGNLDRSTDATIALNNAFLASGSSASDAARGTEQYVQMLAKGEVDLQSWRSIQETMPVGLQKTAEAMGFTGAAAQQDLYSALQAGEVTFRDFEDSLIRLGTGTGELAALAQTNSEGIATSFANLKNSVAKGLAGIMEDIDALSENVTGKNIAQNLDGLKVMISNTFNAIGIAIRATEPILKVFVISLQALGTTAQTLSPVLMGVAAAFTALKIIETVNKIITANNALITANTGLENGSILAKQRATHALMKQGLAYQAATMSEKQHMLASESTKIATSALNGVMKVKTALIGVLTGKVTLATAAQVTMAAASKALGAAITFMSGPIGIATVAIGALVAAGVGLHKWLNRSTEEGKKLGAETSKLTEEMDKLSNSVKDNVASRKDEIQHNNSTAETYKKMAEETAALAEQERISAADKKIIKDNVEELNKQYAGLNMAYDEERGLLSMTGEEAKKKIDAYSNIDNSITLQEQLVEAQKEEHMVAQKLKESTALRKEWDTQLKNGDITAREHRKNIKEIDEQEAELIQTQKTAGEEVGRLSKARQEAAAAEAEAVKNGVMDQKQFYESLSEAQKQAVDAMKETYDSLVDKASSTFDAIEQKETISLEQMKKNLQSNAEAMAEWSTSIKTLAENGVSNGVLAELEKLGPEGAKQAKRLVDETTNELGELTPEGKAQIESLNEVYTDGMREAMDSTARVANKGKDDVIEKLSLLPGDAQQSLKGKMEDANFKEIGKEIPDEVAAGVEENKEEPKKAAEGLGKTIFDSINPLDSEANAKNAGKKVTDDFTAGLNENKESAIQTSREIGFGVPKGIGEGIIETKRQASDSAKEAGEEVGKSMETSLNPLEFSLFGQNAMGGVKDGIDQGNAQIGPSMDGVKQSLIGPLQKTPEEAGTAMTGFGNSISSGVSEANSHANNGMDQMKSSFGTLNPATTSSGQQSMSSFNSEIKGGMSQADSSTQTGNATIKSSFKGLEQDVKSTSNSAMANFTSSIKKGMSNAGADVQKAAGTIGDSFSTMSSDISSKSDRAMSQMTNAFRQGTSSTASAVREMVNSASNTVRTLNESFSSAGHNASIGLANGIRASAGAAMNAAVSLANSITSTLRDAMRIHSPSRVMRDEIGRYIPQGIAAGIDKDADEVQKSLLDITDSLLSPISPEVALGLNKGSLGTGGAASVLNTSNQNTTINNDTKVNVYPTWNGKEDIVKTMQEIAWQTEIDTRGGMIF